MGRIDLDKQLETDILFAIVQASMCWDPLPSTEVFDSDKAVAIAMQLRGKILTWRFNIQNEET